MSFKVLFLAALTALVSSCGSNDSVKDDWPGIDEIRLIDGARTQSLAVNNQFSLNSSVSLPKMGKDVSFTFQTSCYRELPSGSKKKNVYTKAVDYKASENQSIDSLDVVDHLAEEVLIFPEFFKTCDLKLIAKNQNGSTDNSNLVGYEFVLDEDSKSIQIDRASEDLSAVKTKDIQRITAKAKNGSSLTDSQLVCYTDKVSKSTISKNSEKELSGTLFKLPTPTRDIPVENCVVTALNNENKTVVSNRIQILNSDSYKKFTAGVSSYIVGKDATKQVFYENSLNGEHSILRFVISNESDSLQVLRFPEGASSYSNIDIVTHLTQLTNTNAKGARVTQNFKMNYKKMPALYHWKNRQLAGKDQITIKPGGFETIELKLKTSFLCPSTRAPSFRHQEVGFIASLLKSSKVFNLQHMSVNSFTNDSIVTGNIFDSFNLPYKLPSNLPKGNRFTSSKNSIEIFFRNNKINSNNPLKLTYVQTRVVYSQKTGEPINLGRDSRAMKSYPFMGYTDPNGISCISKDALEQ